MAGLFEETGRFTAFKTILKKNYHNDRNVLMYGAGHGGFEAFYILFFSMISNMVMAFMLNADMAEKIIAGITDDVKLQTIYATFQALTETAPITFLISLVEHIAALALHISLSVLVWFAAKNKGKIFWYYPLALLLHAAVNAITVILSKYVSSMWIILFVIYIMAAFCVVIVIKVWKRYSASNVKNVKTLNPGLVLAIIILFTLIISVAGCSKNVTFSGSKTSNDNQFLVDFNILNTTVKSEMLLLEGETIETTIDIKKGKVDIMVENKNGKFAYRGNDVRSCNFTIEIEEADTYTFSVTGYKARGSVYFKKLTSISENFSILPVELFETADIL